MTEILCLDVGSTFTKAALVSVEGELLATAETPTTQDDVLTGCREAAGLVGAPPGTTTYACSSAGGGLRLAVVGYERQVTADAGRRVGLTAGAKVVDVSARRLDDGALRTLEAARPDVVLLVGGTDGGNADVLRHNATRLAAARLGRPVVVAGNVDAREEVVALLAAGGQPVVPADNVLPRIGVVAPDSARAAIRSVFLDHVIGGTGLAAGREFRSMVRAPTPDAVLRGVEVTASALGQDLLVVDVGGATTDVYSAVRADGPGEHGAPDLGSAVVSGFLPVERTVEGDLGVRWSAVGVVEAAGQERLPVSVALPQYAARVAADPTHLSRKDIEQDLELATVAALVAIRRHGRPSAPGRMPRPLGDVGLVLGSGGALRHARDGGMRVLTALTDDQAGGWRVPRHATVATDHAYRLFAVGLLADEHPDAARHLARALR